MTEADLDALGLDRTRLARLRDAVPELHGWYRASARDLPWRQTRDPYAIWVSEVMLQQTRVDTVIPYYRRWLAAFPTVEALAGADLQQVLSLWEGLGYYSRARNLCAAAREVVERFGGAIPSTPALFRGLRGVGDYTAAAVLSIAFGHDLAVVDGNVRRVLARLTALRADPRSARVARALGALAQALLPPGTAALHNQAVMELGATLCTPRQPSCHGCPLEVACAAKAAGSPEAYPVRRPGKALPHYDVALGLVFDADDRVFIDRRPYGGLLGGLWEFPGGKVEEGETLEEALRRELREEFAMKVRTAGSLPPVRHAYSHFRVTLHPFLCRFVAMEPRAAEAPEWLWVDPDELGRYPMPRANRKILEHLTAWEAD